MEQAAGFVLVRGLVASGAGKGGAAAGRAGGGVTKMAACGAGNWCAPGSGGGGGVRQYLLLQTSYGEHHWTPPKGHVDPGETKRETAVRETKEEAGLVLGEDFHIVDGFEETLRYHVRGKEKEVVYWLGEVSSETTVRLSDEHQSWKWAPLQEACQLAKYTDMARLLNMADKFLSNKYNTI